MEVAQVGIIALMMTIDGPSIAARETTASDPSRVDGESHTLELHRIAADTDRVHVSLVPGLPLRTFDRYDDMVTIDLKGYF